MTSSEVATGSTPSTALAVATPDTSEVYHDPKSRIARYDRYYDVRTFSYVYRKSNKPVESKFSKKLSVKRTAILVVRQIDERGRFRGSNLEIKSDGLCQLLIDINADVEGVEISRTSPECDPKLLFTSFAGLQKALKDELEQPNPDEALVLDIQAAIAYVEDEYSDLFANIRTLSENRTITFADLWGIFVSQTLIYYYDQMSEQPVIILCQSFEYERQQDGSYHAIMEYDAIHNDGRSFGLVRLKMLVAKAFRGSRSVQELGAYPLQYHSDPEELRSRIIERGRKFTAMCSEKFSYREICGPGVDTHGRKFNTYGRVMVDHAAYRLFNPMDLLNPMVYRQLDKEDLTDEQYLICSPVMLGFCFGAKSWGGFALDRMTDVIWSDEAFNGLVLGDKQKRLIHSLVKQHSAKSASFDDIVLGKGKGLIGLLAGRPGCGKTLTAEAVAEVIHRPLYTMSAGELGTSASEVDGKLTQILQLAQTWDAVLLLDEAEVFLLQRDGKDIARNALVSIFLRQLEYYQGILILTTNMVADCDLAFESRIHFSVHYPDLDFDARRKIWKTFLKKVKMDVQTIDESAVDRLAELQLNGRQIKNTVSTAQTLAMEMEEPLKMEHIETVFDVARDWDKARNSVDFRKMPKMVNGNH